VTTDDDAAAPAPAPKKKVVGKIPLLGISKEAQKAHSVDVKGKPAGTDGSSDLAPDSGLGSAASGQDAPEVDTLVAGKDVPAQRIVREPFTTPDGRTATPYNPDMQLPLPEHVRPLVTALELAAPRAGLRLGLACGRLLTLTCAGVGRMPVDRLVGVGSSWTMVECGLPRAGVLVADDSISVALADLMLGGSGVPEDRQPVRVEIAVLRRHLTTALSPVTDALAEIGVTHLALSDPPTDDIVEFLAGGEIIAIRLEIKLDDEQMPGALVLALPSRLVIGGAAETNTVDRQGTARTMSGVPVDLVVQFAATTLSAYDMAGLECGDVLRLEVDQPAVIGQINGLPLLTAGLGRSGRNRAIVVQSVAGGAS
jgi:hypothetical protein